MASTPITNRAVVPTICDGWPGFTISEKKTASRQPEGVRQHLSRHRRDPRRLIVMDQVVPADFGVNNNAMSSAVVMDERGNVLATVEQFFFFNTFLTIGRANNLAVDPATRTAYTLGPDSRNSTLQLLWGTGLEPERSSRSGPGHARSDLQLGLKSTDPVIRFLCLSLRRADVHAPLGRVEA